MIFRKAVQEPEWRLLHRIADDLEPRFRKTFLDAFRNSREDISIASIQRAVELGDMTAFDELVPWQQLAQEASKDVQVIYREGIERAADGTIKFLPASVTQEGVTATFDVLDERVVEFMRERSSTLVDEVTGKTQAAIRQSLTRHLERGTNPRRAAKSLRDTIGLTERQARAADNFLARQLQDGNVTVGQAERRAERYRNRLLRQRTESIARTESIRAANAGQNQLWNQLEAEGVINEGEMVREWIVTPDDRLCEMCEELDGVRVGLRENFPGADMPPLHPMCLPGDAFVLAEGVTGHSKRWYEGPLVRIRTRRGYDLTCTPNHPILTSRGWIPAGKLEEGDDVVSNASDEWPLTARLNDDQVQASIEELVDARIQSAQVPSRPVPVAAEHFHGDGRHSEVAVVGSDLHLRDRRQAPLGQEAKEAALVGAVMLAFLGSGARSAKKAAPRGGRSARSAIRGLHLAGSLFASHAGPLHALGLALRAQANAGAAEVPFQGSAADALPLGELVDRLPVPVLADEVVEVGEMEFSGHVYNLETAAGMYVANGIVTHNCRCAVQLVKA